MNGPRGDYRCLAHILPRLPVWEEANEPGLLGTASINGPLLVRIIPTGLALLPAQKQKSA